MVALRTYHSTYITFEQNTNEIKGDRTEIGNWEKLKIIKDPSNPTHGWIEDSTGYNLLDTSDGPRRGKTDDMSLKYMGLWFRENESLSIQSNRTGKWLRVGSAEEGFPVSFSADEAGPYETLGLVSLESGYRQIEGQLTYDEGMRAIKDNNGPILPCFTHLGDLRALFSVNRELVRQVLTQVRDNQYTGNLSWSILNDESEANPWHIPPYFWLGPKHQTSFWKDTEDFALLHKELGLVWLFVAGGLNNFSGMPEARDFMNQFCDVADRVGPEVFVYEVVNELHASSNSFWHDPNKIEELADIVRSRHPRMIVMTSSLGGVEDPGRLAPYNKKTRLVSHHQFRGFHVGNKADHPWTFGFEAIPHIKSLSGNPYLYRGWGTEPCGPFSDIDAWYGNGPNDNSKVRAYVSVQENGHRGQELNAATMGLIAAKNYAGGLAFNFFCAAGVKYFDGANLDNYPGFNNVGKLAQLLPQDAWTYEWLGHGNPDRPWSHMRIFHPPTNARADGFWANDGRFLNTLSGINDKYQDEFDYQILKNCRFTLLDPGSLQSWQIEKRAGEMFRTGMAVVFGSTI